MPVKMNNTSTIKAHLGINPNGRVQKYFTKRCADYMDKYVPMDTGALRNNIVITEDQIQYQSPYAHYMYIGKLYVMENGKGAYYNEKYCFWSKKGVAKTMTETPLKYSKPGSGSYWDKKMWTAEGQNVIDEVQKYIRGK